jgi:hypothetical protein
MSRQLDAIGRHEQAEAEVAAVAEGDRPGGRVGELKLEAIAQARGIVRPVSAELDPSEFPSTDPEALQERHSHERWQFVVGRLAAHLVSQPASEVASPFPVMPRRDEGRHASHDRGARPDLRRLAPEGRDAPQIGPPLGLPDRLESIEGPALFSVERLLAGDEEMVKPAVAVPIVEGVST